MSSIIKSKHKTTTPITLILLILILLMTLAFTGRNAIKMAGDRFAAACDTFASTNLQLKAEKVSISGARFTDLNQYIEDISEKECSILSINIREIARSIASNPWIENVSIKRKLPNEIAIDIIEREPAVLIENEQGLFLSDINGHFLSNDPKGIFSGLLKIGGIGDTTDNICGNVYEAVSLINSEPLLAKLARRADRIGNRRWDITLENGIIVKLPENNPEQAWKYMAVMQQKRAEGVGEAKVIDLRIKGMVSFVRD